jgi:hypothetical protein
MASSPITGIASQVWPLIPQEVIDNISIAHPVFFDLYENSKKTWKGGTQYQPVVLYASDSEGAFIDPTSISASLGTTQTQKTEGIVYNTKAVQNPYSITLDEKTRAGASEYARITLQESKIIQATNRHVELISTNMYKGDLNGNALQFWGLDQICSLSDATPFVGQIDQSVDTWWAPSTITTSTTFNSLNPIITRISVMTDGGDKPDMGILGQVLHPRLVQIMGGGNVNTKIDNKETVWRTGDISVQDVRFIKDKGATDDGASTGNCYILTTKYLEFWFDSSFDFWSSGFTEPVAASYNTGYIRSVLFLATTQRRRQGGYVASGAGPYPLTLT